MSQNSTTAIRDSLTSSFANMLFAAHPGTSAPSAFTTACQAEALSRSDNNPSVLSLSSSTTSASRLTSPSQAFFNNEFHSQRIASIQPTIHCSLGTKSSSTRSSLVDRTTATRRAPFAKKGQTRKDSTFNCTNVYPHVETTEMYQYDDVSDDDGIVLLRRACIDNMNCGDYTSSENDESECEYDSDDFLSSVFADQSSDDELMIEFGRKPQVFDDNATMTFYISPMAIGLLATGLWTRSRPACVIINTSIPRRKRFDDMDWSADALRMLNTPNAGGSSLLSEVLSCEMLNRCLGATLANTEMEIQYLFACQPITDYTITLPYLSPRMHVGVSVTRAFAFKGAYRKADCRKLLWKKLSGILASTRNVIGERFFKQILHIWVPNGKVARTVQATYKSLPVEVTRNTVVIISVVNAAWVFSNRR
ncbi:hypothetical protein EDD21DRAFT_444702 [Dissophora ornata]|nr:hypothetical protein EDD21DRAFT_444702 [Dissophora ornata]